MSDVTDIAIIGMAIRCPGARNLAEFWRNLRTGVESIILLSDEEIEPSAFRPLDLRSPDFVRAAFLLDDIDLFDADFFAVPPSEAELMDPQQRFFLECAWEAMEDAGYDLTSHEGNVAIYAGSTDNAYMLSLVLGGLSPYESYQMLVGNRKDHLATRTSYKLNLKGESVNIQTTCSTSLVAMHLACQSLLNGQSHIALAGGVSIQVPQKTGYLYQKDMIYSPDGHCRAFDRHAAGTNFGNGVGVVVLKPLDEALQDHDHVYAVIKGSAINNDGRDKVGYTAPSVEGQGQVISTALEFAGVPADTIGYVEAHGTGTALGDPIEIEALSQEFRRQTARRGFCAIGSVKTNIGHLDAAAGVVGLIKTALVLHHKMIPPSLNFVEPNPLIDFAATPFYVNTELREWPAWSTPRRAAVSAFGIGGTNAHAVLEEAPEVAWGKQAEAPTGPSGKREQASPTAQIEREKAPLYLLALSAKSETALRKLAKRYELYLREQPDVSLSDLCFTAGTGRVHFEHRLALIAGSVLDLEKLLRQVGEGEVEASEKMWIGRPNPRGRPKIAFLFTGQGSQYHGMGGELYTREPAFRAAFDRCDELLHPHLGVSLREELFAGSAETSRLRETWVTQPALFALEYSLAQLWASWGIWPDAVLGHSVGEYAAACVSGALSLEDGLHLVAERGRLMAELPSQGMMIAVLAAEGELQPWLNDLAGRVYVAAVNGPANTVISGESEAVENLTAALTSSGIAVQPLVVSHAFHSPLIEPMLDDFERAASRARFRLPQIPLVSNLTGRPLSQAPDARYWRKHTSASVHFADGIDYLITAGYNTFLEIGPHPVLTALGQQVAPDGDQLWLASLRRGESESLTCIRSLANLYVEGVTINWARIDTEGLRRRLSLPTYPFEGKRYWFTLAANRPSLWDGPTRPDTNEPGETEAGPDAAPSRRRLQDVPIEAQVMRIWGALLGRDADSLQEDFFAAGGDSVLAIQLLARCRRELRADVSIREFFAAPTPEHLAAKIAALLREGDKANDQIITLASRDGHLPLSFAQERFWFLYQFEEQPFFYHVPIVAQMRGKLNVAALEHSLAEVQRRHETLRMRFPTEADGAPTLLIEPPWLDKVPLIDLSQLSAAEREAQARLLTEEFVRRPFDLGIGPLWRVHLLRLADEEHIFTLVMHHMISDIWSAKVLISEVATIYQAFTDGLPSPLPELAVQYVDFAVWQRELLQSSWLDELLSFWRRQLAGARATALPTDRPRGNVRSLRGHTVPVELAAELTEKIEEFSREQGVSLFMLLLAGFVALLRRLSGEQDIVIGTEVSARSQIETEALIGAFVNQLVIRLDLSDDPTFQELLARTRNVTLAAYEHQDMPFDKLVELLKPERRANTTPFFNIKLLFDNTPLEQAKLPGVNLSQLEMPIEFAPFDLTLRLRRGEAGLVGSMTYSANLFERATMTRFPSQLEMLLRNAIAQPGARISWLEILSPEERKQIVDENQKRVEQKRRSLAGLRRQATGAAPERLIKTRLLKEGDRFPLVVEPAVSDVDLVAWAENNHDFIEAKLLEHGAILFRGFDFSTAAQFQRLALAIHPELVEYSEPSTTRSEYMDKVYVSSEYPEYYNLPLHSELSYTYAWPKKALFFCRKAAQLGGETPLADNRQVLALMDPVVREKFRSRRVMYLRNYGDGLLVPWQKVFKTDDPKEVEHYCQQHPPMWCEWKDETHLRTRQVRPGVIRHPITGEEVWFNQAHVFHIHSMGGEIAERLLSQFAEEDLPVHAFYGDGARIEDAEIDEVFRAYREAAYATPWQDGDVMLVDNVMMSHGRNAFKGPREVIVAFVEPGLS